MNIINMQKKVKSHWRLISNQTQKKKRCKKHMHEQKKVTNMVDMNPIVSVINLYVNDLTKTTKRECWNG